MELYLRTSGTAQAGAGCVRNDRPCPVRPWEGTLEVSNLSHPLKAFAMTDE